MSDWCIAVCQDDMAEAKFIIVRHLSDDEYESLISVLVILRKILGRTAWNVLQSNYASFKLTEGN